MIKKLFENKLFSLSLILLVLCFGGVYLKNNEPELGNNLLGVNYPDSQWVSYNSFTGFQTDVDPEKVEDGANPMGQNTTPFENDRFGIRQLGFENFPNTEEASTTPGKIVSVHNFRKRNSDNILMRSYGTVLEFYDTIQNKWIVLKSGLTEGKKFGFSDYNINTDHVSYTYFGNAYDNFMRWTGSLNHLTSDVSSSDTVIQMDNTDDFTSTSTISICGHIKTANSKTSTSISFATSTGFDCLKGQEVFEVVEEFANNPKGNIYINYDNRLFIAGIIQTPQAVYFSKYADATYYLGATLVDASTADAPGIFNLGEGGGSVTGLSMDEESLYILKRSIIYKVGLTDVAYSILPLKTFDGRSQTVGAVNSGSVFAGGNGIYFITPDNQILNLERIAQVDYPQLTPISNRIKNTVFNADFSESSGIVYRDKAFFAFKQSSESTNNDVVLIYNINEKTWDSPIVGWNVQDWSVYNDEGVEELYFSSSVSYNISKVIESPMDGGFDVKANWRSKKYNFGSYNDLKEIRELFIDGYISENTTLKVSMLLDDDGYNQIFSTEIKGTDKKYLYYTDSYNVFGFNPFGVKRFGGNDDQPDKKRFRVYLTGFRANPFYTLQLEFASEGENQNWEILNYGMLVQKSSQPELRTLYKEFK